MGLWRVGHAPRVLLPPLRVPPRVPRASLRGILGARLGYRVGGAPVASLPSLGELLGRTIGSRTGGLGPCNDACARAYGACDDRIHIDLMRRDTYHVDGGPGRDWGSVNILADQPLRIIDDRGNTLFKSDDWHEGDAVIHSRNVESWSVRRDREVLFQWDKPRETQRRLPAG